MCPSCKILERRHEDINSTSEWYFLVKWMIFHCWKINWDITTREYPCCNSDITTMTFPCFIIWIDITRTRENHCKLWVFPFKDFRWNYFQHCMQKVAFYKWNWKCRQYWKIGQYVCFWKCVQYKVFLESDKQELFGQLVQICHLAFQSVIPGFYFLDLHIFG